MSKSWETYRAGRTVRIRPRPVRYHASSKKAAPPVATPIAEPVEVEAVDYESLTKAGLVAEAESRGLDSSGTKADIIGRLG